jgi:hypothetical protein
MAVTPDGLVANSDTEHSIQTAFFCWISIVKLPGTQWVHAIHNQGHGDKVRGGRARAEGARSGVWDVFVPVPSRVTGHHGLYIEFKRPMYRNRRHGGLKPDQMDFGLEAHHNGYRMKVVYTWREAAQTLCEYLGIEFVDVVG